MNKLFKISVVLAIVIVGIAIKINIDADQQQQALDQQIATTSSVLEPSLLTDDQIGSSQSKPMPPGQELAHLSDSYVSQQKRLEAEAKTMPIAKRLFYQELVRRWQDAVN